jgi:hypothetical protein
MGQAMGSLVPSSRRTFGRVESPDGSHVPLTTADGRALGHVSRNAGEVHFTVDGHCFLRNRSTHHELVARRWELTTAAEIPLPSVSRDQVVGPPQLLAPGRWLVRNGRHGRQMTDPTPEQTAWLVVDVPRIRRTGRERTAGDTLGEIEEDRPRPPACRLTPAESYALEAYFGEFISWPPHRSPAMRNKEHAARAAGDRAQHQALSAVLRKARDNGYPHDRAGEALWAWLVQRSVVNPDFIRR